MKIIPAIDLMDGNVVRLYKGNPKEKIVYSNKPIDVAKKLESDGADYIHIVDLDATLGLGQNQTIIQEITKIIKIPIQVAGGLRTREKIQQMLKNCSRVVIGTLAFNDQKSIVKLLEEYSNRIIISADYINGIVVTHGWQKNTNISLITALDDFIKLGCTEFLLTNVQLDGTLQGPDYTTLKTVCQKTANIIASGGVSSLQDVKNIKNLGADAVILGKALYEGKITIQEAKHGTV